MQRKGSNKHRCGLVNAQGRSNQHGCLDARVFAAAAAVAAIAALAGMLVFLSLCQTLFIT